MVQKTACRWLIGLAPMLVCCSLAMAQKVAFDPGEMLDIRDFSGEIAVSPNGTWVAYVLPDLSDEWNILERRPRGWVHVMPLERESSPGLGRPLTAGAERSSFPVWSQGGNELAFVSESEAGVYLKVWDAATDTIRQLEPALPAAPYLAPLWALRDAAIVVAPELAPPAAGAPPRVQEIKSSQQVLPGDAFFADTRLARLWLVSTRGERRRELISSPLPLRSWEAAPNGLGLFYQIAARPGMRQEGRSSQILDLTQMIPPLVVGSVNELVWMSDSRLLVRREDRWNFYKFDPSAETRWMADFSGTIRRPVFGNRPDRFLMLVEDPSQSDPEIEPPQPDMYTIARPFWDLYLVSDDGKSTNITADLPDQVSSPVWSPDGESFYFQTTHNETYEENLWRYDLASGNRVRLFGGNYAIQNLNPVAGAANGILFTLESATSTSDLWFLEHDSSQPRRLTELNPQLRDIHFSEPELFHFKNADGDTMGALLYKPAGYQPGQKFPVVTYVYEKLTPGKNRFMPRHQLFLQHGFGILMPNVKVKVGATGDSFVQNIVPAVEAVKKMGISNDRFALWGGSFGAYATSFVITQTNVFSCAVSRATPPELFRNWASGRDRDSDNIERGQARMGGSPFEVMDRYLSQSAFFHLDKVETPVLIMHGKADLTILFGEGEMMFYALRRLGKEATFVAYEHGDHSLYRHSRADALDVHQRMLDWFARYLKGDEQQ